MMCSAYSGTDSISAINRFYHHLLLSKDNVQDFIQAFCLSLYLGFGCTLVWELRNKEKHIFIFLYYEVYRYFTCVSVYHVCAVPTKVRSRHQSHWAPDSLEKQVMLLITEPSLQQCETYFEGGKKSLN